MKVPKAISPIIIKQKENSLVGKAITVGIIGFGLWYANKLYKEQKALAEGERISTSSASASASEITQAVNPSGISWLRPVDGTNAVSIMEAIRKALSSGKAYKDVSDSYKSLTEGRSLEQDLKKELSTSQYNTFLNIVRLSSAVYSSLKGQSLTVNANVIVRKTPYINGSPRLFDRRGNSIEYIEDVGKFIGVATGKYEVTISRSTILSDSASIATLFYEATVYASDKKLYNVWVAASQVKINPNKKPSSFSSMYIMDINAYKKAEAINKPFLEG